MLAYKPSNFVLSYLLALRPAVILGLENKTAAYPQNYSVVMFCNVSGNPPPQVSWSFQGRQLTLRKLNAARVCDQFESGYYYYKTQSRLVVCKPHAYHSGPYTCFAENRQRKENRTAILYVSGRFFGKKVVIILNVCMDYLYDRP